MTNYTTGPWKYTAKGRRYCIRVDQEYQRGGEGEVLAQHIEFAPDARLMATAPELIETLEKTNELLVGVFAQVSDPSNRQGWSDDEAYKRYMRNLEVIVKARGQ